LHEVAAELVDLRVTAKMAMPFRRVLIANRGEIAVRVIRACRELGLETVQVYSEADRESLPVRLADQAVCIGPARARQSYLNGEFIVSAALTHGADAIHPGYGFLAENAAFARLCAKQGIAFIGPSADAISSMGDKASAKRMAQDAGVPTVPGSKRAVSDLAEVRAIGEDIGYPVLLKASAGGGGRGMRVVRNQGEVASQYANAAREALAAFGDDAIYVEKYLTNIRHVEIQILSDGETVLHLGERDCSIQLRNQKLVEESPSTVVDESLRTQLGQAAVRLCKHVGYTSAGTIECIVDARSGEFYFMEMNTRIQVEHPVTEMVTGIDIVKQQIRVAQGQPLGLRQSDVGLRGHAIECRINAEDPDNSFAPCPGVVRQFHAPGGPGIRVDSHLYSGYRIPPYYDSLLAKVIAWGEDRQEALARMRRALSEMEIEGVTTTIPFHQKLLGDACFRNGDVHTTFVEDVLMAGP
jgi:acetyl-CoA carboxylase, biotin carboxylase subunit